MEKPQFNRSASPAGTDNPMIERPENLYHSVAATYRDTGPDDAALWDWTKWYAIYTEKTALQEIIHERKEKMRERKEKMRKFLGGY